MKKLLLTIALISVTAMTYSQNNDSVTAFDSNFAHVVYFWFHNPDDTNARKRFEASLKQFLNTSKYAKTNFIGIAPKAVRDVVDDTFTYNLVVTFESAEAQEAYQHEEAHLTFIEECKDLWSKVIVYDALGIEN